ncbi:MarR family winged helix-turn-helix transcriptional regulator [Sphingobacterium yanglingense]|uniref:DNA-binding MarR family transcriptional regulator n=1 Tax=Sphingobacterium yanglingense TaxID=1437280 RepID=A0A4R6WFJ1_9SPHI|nr:MarR family transcriptional regulator [Sphingobacterium yanglingense]TDQ77072.1 DNA-binding MarR family transcriptional regulator [Sphingobacterium yanglingense]
MLNESYNQYSFILDRTARKVKQYAQTAFAEQQFDLTVDQWIVLRTIYENPSLSNKEMAELCGKDQPTLTRIIDLLIKKEFAERISHPSDRRSLRLHITKKGEDKIQEIAPKVADFRMQAWKNLNEEDFAHFTRILNTIYDNLTQK